MINVVGNELVIEENELLGCEVVHDMLLQRSCSFDKRTSSVPGTPKDVPNPHGGTNGLVVHSVSRAPGSHSLTTDVVAIAGGHGRALPLA